MSSKVGLLVPRSVLYPSVSFDLIGGLSSSLAHRGLDSIEVKTESIGIAGNEKSIYASCEQLLYGGARVVAGYVNAYTAQALEPLFESADALFIALDSGYHFPASISATPHIFNLSLQGALCDRITTQNAIDSGLKGFVLSASFYDAGYRGTYVIHRCIAEAGGRVVFNHVSPLKRADFTLDPMRSHLNNNRGNAVIASFCGDMFFDFCAGAAKENLFQGIPVYGSSFMGEELWADRCTYPGADIRVSVPWLKGLGNDDNTKFCEVVSGKNIKVNIFSLLGWEAGMLVEKIITAGSTSAAIKALEGSSIDSPRGTIIIDAAHRCLAPVYDAIVRKNETTGNCMVSPLGTSTIADAQREKLETDILSLSGPVSSWFNAYPCLES